MTLEAWVLISLAVVIGAAVQSKLGFGMIILILPVLLIVDPTVVPAPVLIASLPLGAWVSGRDRWSVNARDVSMTFVLRALGAVVATWLLDLFTTDSLVIFAGLSVLGAVAISATRVHVPKNSGTLSVAGFLSGTFGTAVGIGGPPLAVVYQHEPPSVIRGNLGLILLLGLPVSLAVLALGGFLGTRELLIGLSLWPAVGIGIAVSEAVGQRLDDRIRPLVLSVAALGAIVAMSRVLL